MGGSSSKLDPELVDEYEELTHFSKGEINKLYIKFSSLDERITPENVNKVRLDESQIRNLPEFACNPLLHRLVHVFSTTQDYEEDRFQEEDEENQILRTSLSFEDFLDMMNALSERAPFKLKAHYVFRIMDFDGDDFIGADDIRSILDCTAKNGNDRLDDSEVRHLTKAIMSEADLDKDNQLGESEFEHMLKKTPDFMESFIVRII